MVSRIPTYSFKRVRVPQGYVMPVLILIAALATLLVTAPWYMLPLLGLLYAATFPFSLKAAMKARRAAANDDAGNSVAPPGEPAEPVAEPPADNNRPQAN
jgi:CDP-diacylglycerol--serine O-phosphatidyltransferase